MLACTSSMAVCLDEGTQTSHHVIKFTARKRPIMQSIIVTNEAMGVSFGVITDAAAVVPMVDVQHAPALGRSLWFQFKPHHRRKPGIRNKERRRKY